MKTQPDEGQACASPSEPQTRRGKKRKNHVEALSGEIRDDVEALNSVMAIPESSVRERSMGRLMQQSEGF